MARFSVPCGAAHGIKGFIRELAPHCRATQAVKDQHADAEGQQQSDESEGPFECRLAGQPFDEQPGRAECIKRGQGRQSAENTTEYLPPHQLHFANPFMSD